MLRIQLAYRTNPLFEIKELVLQVIRRGINYRRYLDGLEQYDFYTLVVLISLSVYHHFRDRLVV